MLLELVQIEGHSKPTTCLILNEWNIALVESYFYPDWVFLRRNHRTFLNRFLQNLSLSTYKARF